MLKYFLYGTQNFLTDQFYHNEPKKFNTNTTITSQLFFYSHLLRFFFLLFLKKNPADIQTIKVQVHILETFVGVTFSLLVGSSHRQSHCIEVVQEDILMEQKMTFGLVLGRSAILKKKFWSDYEQLLRAFFSCFHGQKQSLKYFFKYPSVHTKKLQKRKVRKSAKNSLKFSYTF